MKINYDKNDVKAENWLTHSWEKCHSAKKIKACLKQVESEIIPSMTCFSEHKQSNYYDVTL